MFTFCKETQHLHTSTANLPTEKQQVFTVKNAYTFKGSIFTRSLSSRTSKLKGIKKKKKKFFFKNLNKVLNKIISNSEI